MTGGGLKLMLVAIEASGDQLGARLMEALQARSPLPIAFVGVGGPRMAELGLTSAFDPRELAVLGAFNALGAYPKVLRRAREVGRLAARETPDAAVLIDAWGFSLRVARAVRRARPDVKVIKYVAPQVWATRPGRARTLAAAVDHLLTIHAFDAPWFEAEGLATTFVGNPVLAMDLADVDGAAFRAGRGIPPQAPLLLVLPGSRTGEVRRLMPPFEAAARRLGAVHPDLALVIGVAQGVEAEVRALAVTWPSPLHLAIGEAEGRAAMAAATAALACSGTVTTELAMAGRPMVVGYRLDGITYEIAKRLIRTPFITLLNVAANEAIVPELIQSACEGGRLADALDPLLRDPVVRRAQVARQSAALTIMRGGVADPASRAAETLLDLIGARG